MDKYLNRQFVPYIAVLSFAILSTQSFSQTYDQLKVQLQFENYYGSKFRSTVMTEELTGSEFLFDEWLPMVINLPNGSVNFERGKINLYTSSTEVIFKDQEKYIAPEHLKLVSLPTLGRWFIPGSRHQFKGISMLGFIEIFEPSPEPPFIFVNHYIYLREPNSDGYANAGNLTKKLIKASNIYLFDGSNPLLIKSKKQIGAFYTNEKSKFIKLSKEFGTDFKNPKSIQKLVYAMSQ
jgi:hypothetical protein